MSESATAADTGAPGQLSTRQIRLVFVALVLGISLAALDSTIVATALPTIVGDLGGLNHLSWVVTSYLLATTVSTPLWGKLGDLYGRKRFFQAAIVIFLIGSVLSGIAQNLDELVLYRAIQGLGAGGLIVGAQSIVGDIVPPRDRGRYSGVITGVFASASVAGPLLGGFFTDSLSWRWVFYINIPIGAVALVVVASFLRLNVTTRVEHTIDYLGAAVLSAAVTALTLVMTWGGTTYAWGSATIIGLVIFSVVLFAVFIPIERRAVEPVLPLALFETPTFSLAFVIATVVGFAMFGAITFLPLFLQVVHGVSPTKSGLQMVPIMGVMLVASVLNGRRISVSGRYRASPIIGTALITLSLLGMSHLSPTTPYWLTAIFMAGLGGGLGLTMQVLMIASQNAVPYRLLGVATSTASFGRSVGASLGVAIFGTVFNNRLAANLPKHVTGPALKSLHGSSVTANPTVVKHLPPLVREGLRLAFSDSLHIVFLVAVPIAALAFVLTWFMKEVPLRKTIVFETESAEGEAELAAETLGMQPAPGRDFLTASAGGDDHEALSPDSSVR